MQKKSFGKVPGLFQDSPIRVQVQLIWQEITVLNAVICYKNWCIQCPLKNWQITLSRSTLISFKPLKVLWWIQFFLHLWAKTFVGMQYESCDTYPAVSTYPKEKGNIGGHAMGQEKYFQIGKNDPSWSEMILIWTQVQDLKVGSKLELKFSVKIRSPTTQIVVLYFLLKSWIASCRINVMIN